MRNFVRFISDKFNSFASEANARVEVIDNLNKEGTLTKSHDGKRYAIHKIEMSIYEIMAEKNGFIRIKDTEGNVRWEEKEFFYADNIFYNTAEDFIEQEQNKLLSLIDTSRYDVYVPISSSMCGQSPNLETINCTVKQNAKTLEEFIRSHTTADFKNGGNIFSNYILIGF